MAATPVYALPYPLGTDLLMQGDDTIRALAERVEALLAQRDSVPTGRRNVIRNGGMGVAQRGNGPFTGNGTYTLDGWRLSTQGTTGSVTRADAPLDRAPTSALLAYAMGTPAAAAGDYAVIEQGVESVRTLAGQQVTLSFLASSSVAGRSIGIEIQQAFGSGGSPSALVTFTPGAVVLSAALTRYSLTFAMPSIAGKVLGTNGDDKLTVRFWLGAGSTNAGNSGLGAAAGQAAFTLTLTDVQLEAGPVATPFERLSQQAQLAWCQRYFYRIAPIGANYFAIGQAVNTSQVWITILFPVTMRAAPTFTTSGSGFNVMNSGAGDLGATAITGHTTDLFAADFIVTTSPNLRGGDASIIRASGSPGTLSWSAEL